MPTPITPQLDSTIQSFVAEISSLVRVAALEAVRDALGGGASPARRGRPVGSGRKPGRPAKAARRGRPARRSAEDVDALAQRMLAYVKANDGKRLDEIAKALGMDTAELTGPSQMLLETKAVKRSGQRRGTKYHVGGGTSPKSEATPAKAGKRAKKA